MADFPEVPSGLAREAVPSAKTILLAEDEDQLRMLLERLLRLSGYTIVSARDGREALEMGMAVGRNIDLLLSDIDMPEMSGLALADKIALVRPQIKIILMSGTYRTGTTGGDRSQFLQKPFTVDALMAKVASLLDSGGNVSRSEPEPAIAFSGQISGKGFAS